jgi:hypothetical protein
MIVKMKIRTDAFYKCRNYHNQLLLDRLKKRVVKLKFPFRGQGVYSLRKENSCAAAFRAGIHEAINAIIKTVAPTKAKSISFNLTGK